MNEVSYGVDCGLRVMVIVHMSAATLGLVMVLWCFFPPPDSSLLSLQCRFPLPQLAQKHASSSNSKI